MAPWRKFWNETQSRFRESPGGSRCTSEYKVIVLQRPWTRPALAPQSVFVGTSYIVTGLVQTGLVQFAIIRNGEREREGKGERERDRSFIPLIGYSSVQRAFESLENYRGFVPSRQRTVIRFAGDSDLLQLVLLQLVLRIYWINDSIEMTIYSRNSSGDLISDFSLLERAIILILIRVWLHFVFRNVYKYYCCGLIIGIYISWWRRKVNW